MKSFFRLLFKRAKRNDSLIAQFSRTTIFLSFTSLMLFSIFWFSFQIMKSDKEYKHLKNKLAKGKDRKIKEYVTRLSENIHLLARTEDKQPSTNTFDNAFKEKLKAILSLIPLKENEYVFLFLENGDLIALNNQFQNQGGGRKYTSQENLRYIKSNEKKFVEYEWKNLKQNKSFTKKSFIAEIKELGVFMGYGYSKNSIGKALEIEKKKFHSSILMNLFIMAIAIGATISLPIYLSKKTYNRLRSDLKSIFSFFRKGIDNSEDIEIDFINYKELRSLARSFNSIIYKKTKAEKQLRLEQAYLNKIFEKSPEGIIIADEESNILRANPNFLDMFGYKVEQVLGRPIDQLIASKGFYGEASWYTNEILKGKTVEVETLRKHNSGKLVNVSILGSLIDLGKNETAIFGVYRDITERKIAEEELKESEEKWRTLYGNLPGGSYSLNKNNIIEDVNQMLCDLTGFDNKEIIGKHCSLICPERTAGTDILNGENTNIINYETHIKRKDGSLMPVLKSSQKFKYESKEIIVENFLDITKLKEAEASLNQAKMKAEESDRLKSAFLANMSHEIRTPMNAIIGFADLLKDDNFDKKEKNEFLDIIKSNGKSLLVLIDDIIDISQIEAKQLKINKLDCEINDTINDIVITLSETAKKMKKEHIKIRTNCPPEFSRLIVNTDPIRFRQILANLIGNAIKFTKEGSIEIGYYKKDDSTLKFFVRDTGIGIPASKQKVIFSRFRQVDETRNKKVRGNGLGLAITNSLVELLGGEISLTSEENKGTTFYFTLPFKSNTRIVPKESKKDYLPSNTNWEGKRILVAEDSTANFVFLQKALKKTNATIVWAKNGQEAIDSVFKNPETDIVLMDIQMPILNGYQASMAIKEKYPNMPIVAQTAYAMAGEKEIAISSGCDDYVSKPIIIDKLISKINRLLFKED